VLDELAGRELAAVEAAEPFAGGGLGDGHGGARSRAGPGPQWTVSEWP
jgi:hypothetical protein